MGGEERNGKVNRLKFEDVVGYAIMGGVYGMVWVVRVSSRSSLNDKLADLDL